MNGMAVWLRGTNKDEAQIKSERLDTTHWAFLSKN
jgi:hypothetical protein